MIEIRAWVLHLMRVGAGMKSMELGGADLEQEQCMMTVDVTSCAVPRDLLWMPPTFSSAPSVER